MNIEHALASAKIGGVQVLFFTKVVKICTEDIAKQRAIIKYMLAEGMIQEACNSNQPPQNY